MKKTLFTLCSIISIISAPTIVSADGESNIVSAGNSSRRMACVTADFGYEKPNDNNYLITVIPVHGQEKGLYCDPKRGELEDQYVLVKLDGYVDDYHRAHHEIVSGTDGFSHLLICDTDVTNVRLWRRYKRGDRCCDKACKEVEFLPNDACGPKKVWHDDTSWYDSKCSGGDNITKGEPPAKKKGGAPAPEQPVIEEPENGQTGCSGTCCADLPKYQDVQGAMDVLNNFASNAKVSVWVNKDGGFNYARLAADGAAGAVLGTVGGVITHAVIKKNQVDDGMDGYHCTVASESVADYGDEFMLGIPQ